MNDWQKSFAICAALSAFALGPAAKAQFNAPHETPCGEASGWFAYAPYFGWQGQQITVDGLTPTGDGFFVYDSLQNVCWLADANLAANPWIRSLMGVPGINPDGTMDWDMAKEWVAALNAFDNGKGFLGHANWQLPTDPLHDDTCSSKNNSNFGVSCTKAAMAHLYLIGLKERVPNSVVPDFHNLVAPFVNLQPSLYWTSDIDTANPADGESTFSFNTGLSGVNTTKYNFLHVLLMPPGAIGKAPTGKGVIPYTQGPAAWQAVYDTAQNITWPIDANLAATQRFGVTGTDTIPPDSGNDVNANPLTVPWIDSDGAMLLGAADPTLDTSNPTPPTGWIKGMNNAQYLGVRGWQMPAKADLENLYADLRLTSGETAFQSFRPVGPFWNLQPFFYWGCEIDPNTSNTSATSPCKLDAFPGTDPSSGLGMPYSFDFDDGFLGTDDQSKMFNVMVYYPIAK